ncbi:Kelch motif family protein [Histomonas meleagridis]|uniref:Kelch motif family protein n=1 Tax=Histomonas meleagridis TaxID=135588 RepID=UPI00355A28DB|nr:Kelch motif family protein [Histomonas meleagridis]KAH0806493.1 Kelch motif family protein [Histomonas meleagridis]
MSSDTQVTTITLENKPELKIPEDNTEQSPLIPYSYNICFVNQTLFYSSNGVLYYVDLSSPGHTYSWQQDPLLPFKRRYGQSMSVVKQSILFFGGLDENGIYFNDAWIFHPTQDKLSERWTYITTSISQRAFHGATGDPNGNLVICGGRYEDQVFDDFYVLNCTTNVVTKIDFDFNFKFYNHSLTQLPDNKVCLIGGYNEQKKVNSDIILVDIESKSIEKVETDYHNADVDCVNVTHCFDLLMVSGNRSPEKNIKELMMFHFGHKIWIPLSSPKLNPFEPFFCFKNPKDPGSFSMVGIDLSQIIVYKIFQNKFDTFSCDNPEYIRFLERNLRSGVNIFKGLTPPILLQVAKERKVVKDMKKRLRQLIASNGLGTEDKIHSIEQIEKNYHSMTKLANFCFSLKKKITEIKYEIPNFEEPNVHESILQILDQRKQLKEYEETATQEAESLSNRIEILTLLKQSIDSNVEEVNVNKTNETMCASQQLSEKITILKEQIQELNTELTQKLQMYTSLKKLILSNQDQLWKVHKFQQQSSYDTREICLQYYNKCEEVLVSRFREINDYSNDKNMRSTAMSSVTLPVSYENMQKLSGEGKEHLRQISEAITLLSKSSIGCESIALNKAIKELDAMSAWSESVCKELQNNKVTPLALGQVEQRKTSSTSSRRRRSSGSRSDSRSGSSSRSRMRGSIEVLKETAGKWSAFSNDLKRLLKKLSADTCRD